MAARRRARGGGVGAEASCSARARGGRTHHRRYSPDAPRRGRDCGRSGLHTQAAVTGGPPSTRAMVAPTPRPCRATDHRSCAEMSPPGRPAPAAWHASRRAARSRGSISVPAGSTRRPPVRSRGLPTRYPAALATPTRSCPSRSSRRFPTTGPCPPLRHVAHRPPDDGVSPVIRAPQTPASPR